MGCVLTMVGTGSEMNAGAVITNQETKQKIGHVFADERIMPKFAILNPRYTLTLPRYQMVSGIYDIFNQLLNYKVTLIDPGKQVARWAQSFLASEDQLAEGAGKCEFYVTDSIDNFSDIAGIFLGSDLTGQVTQIDIDAVEI